MQHRLKLLQKTETITEILKDLGQVFFASAFLGPLLSSEGKGITVSVGLIFALLSWYCALIVAKN